MMRTILYMIILVGLSIACCTKDNSIDSQKNKSSNKIASDLKNSDDGGNNGKMVVLGLPDVVQRAIKTAYPSGKINEASIEKNSTFIYIIELSEQDLDYTIDVTLDTEGNILSESKHNVETDIFDNGQESDN